jgi:GT2 family glycosyltransferase
MVLYEDADFTLRVAKMGKLYLNTAAQLLSAFYR